MILADAIAMREKKDKEPVRNVFQLFRKFFKKALPQGRAQSDARIMMEWMVQKTEIEWNYYSERPGEASSAVTIDTYHVGNDLQYTSYGFGARP